uniref:SEC63 domain-containing protein n=1 Tax=Cyclophora tenuis TaxID=216820 RepID=A0A7S1DCV9_CYCTE
MFGVNEARKLITTLLEDDSSGNAPTNEKELKELKPFHRPVRVDEVSLAWLLYAVANTHEFDELPVRHNEEHLNEALSEDLMWGADVSSVLNPDHGRSHVNLDVMADPHTKCFLLLQAYLEKAKLPISDYINDTRTVVDQIPRLLAAMYYIALDDTTIAGNFDLLCQFSRIRAIFATRTMVDADPLSQLSGFTNDAIRRLANGAKSRKKNMPSLWELRSQSRADSAALLKGLLKGQRFDVERMLDSVYATPLYSVEEAKVSHEVDKALGKSVGKLAITVEIQYENVKRGRSRDEDTPLTLTVLLGTRLQKSLLAHSTLSLPRRGEKASPSKKKLELKFDWAVANAGGGEEGGSMTLRFLMEDLRGLDTELVVPLS